MFTLMRALTYATLFAGLLLWFVPAEILAMAGLRAPRGCGLLQVIGSLVGSVGLGLAVSCVLAFARLGKGTPRHLIRRDAYNLRRRHSTLGRIN